MSSDTVTLSPLYDDLEQLLSQNDDFNFLEDHISGRLPSDLMMTGAEYNSVYTSDDYKLYVGKKLGLYAVEDYLDQILCKIAKLHGYDVIILTHMVGSHQVVTEVLDTRNDSFSHLWFHV